MITVTNSDVTSGLWESGFLNFYAAWGLGCGRAEGLGHGSVALPFGEEVVEERKRTCVNIRVLSFTILTTQYSHLLSITTSSPATKSENKMLEPKRQKLVTLRFSVRP